MLFFDVGISQSLALPLRDNHLDDLTPAFDKICKLPVASSGSGRGTIPVASPKWAITSVSIGCSACPQVA